MTLNGVMVVSLRYFSEFDRGLVFAVHCIKVVEDIPVPKLSTTEI